MKEELKNLRMLVDLEAKLLEKLKDNLQRVRADGSVNMRYERLMIADIYERIVRVREEIVVNYNYFNTTPPKIVNEDQKQLLHSLENRIEKLEESFMKYREEGARQLFIERKIKITIKPIDEMIKTMRPLESSEIEQRRKFHQTMLLNSVNEFNVTPNEKINWISTIKKSQLYINNPSIFDKLLAQQEKQLKSDNDLKIEIDNELTKIVESSEPIQTKVKNILKTIERGNQGNFYKDYFLMTFLLSDPGKKMVSDINTAPFMLSMDLLNQIADKRDDKEFFDKFMKEQSVSILKSLDTALNQVISGKEASGQDSDEKILFARINKVYNFLTVLPEGIQSVEINNYLVKKLGEIFEKAQNENISTEMQLNSLLKLRDKFKDLKIVKFDDQIQKIIDEKYDKYAWDLRNDLRLIDKNLKGERYTKYAEQINLVQRKIHEFEIAFPDGQFKQKVTPIYELLNNELNRLTSESVAMIQNDNARPHVDQRAKDFYSLYSKIWNMNELSRKIDGKPPEEITQLCERIKQSYSKEEIFKELNRFLKKDDKELTINGKLARLNLTLKYMNLQNDTEAIKITTELLQGIPHGINRIINNSKTSTLDKLGKLNKYNLALKQAQIPENSELRSLLNKTEQLLRENLSNDLTSLSRNLFKNFSPINYINDSSYQHEFLMYPKKLQTYIVDDICKREDPEIRALHMSRWISVAEMSIKKGDIATAMTIFGSLAEQNVQQNHIAMSLLSEHEKQILLCADDWTKGNYSAYMKMLEDPKYSDSSMKVPHPTIMGARLELPRQRGEQLIDTNIPTQLFKMLDKYVESVQTTTEILSPQIDILQSQLSDVKDDSYVIERRVEKYERNNEKYAKAKEQNTQFTNNAQSLNKQAKEQFMKSQSAKIVSDTKEEKYNFSEVMQNLDNKIMPFTNFQDNAELRSGLENLPQIAKLKELATFKPVKKIELNDWNVFYTELGRVKNEIQSQWEAAKKDYEYQKGFLERNLEKQKAGTLADAEAHIKKSSQEVEKGEKRLAALEQKLQELNKIPKEMPEKITEEQFNIFNNNFKCSTKLVNGEFIWGAKSEGLNYKKGDKSFDRFQDMFVYQDGQVLIRDLPVQTRLAKELPKFKDDLYAQVVITLKEIKDMVNIDLRRELAKPASMFDAKDLRHHHAEFIFGMINNRFNDLISKLEKSKNADNQDQMDHLINGLKQEQQKYVDMKQMVNNMLNAEKVELAAQQQKTAIYVSQPIMDLEVKAQQDNKLASLPVQKNTPPLSSPNASTVTMPPPKIKPEADTGSAKPGLWSTLTGGLFGKPQPKSQGSSTAAIFRQTTSGNMDALKSQIYLGKEKEKVMNVGEFIFELNYISQGKRISTISYAKSLSEIAEKLANNLNGTDSKLNLAIYCKDAHDQQIKSKLNIEFERKGGNSYEVSTTLQDIPTYAGSSDTYKRLMTVLPEKYKGTIVQDHDPIRKESVEKNSTVLQQEFSDVEKRAKSAVTNISTQTQTREISNATSMRFKNQ